MVERYHAMAEELNGRGAMELAVPFYRQTIALLLAEREQLRALAGHGTGGASMALSASADVEGVMEAAALVEAAAAPFSEADLRRRVLALEEELSSANAQEVQAALEDLEDQWGQPQAQLLGLRAKLFLLQGALDAAQQCFEQGHGLDPDCPRLQLNAGAARLACGDAAAALALLRPLVERIERLDPAAARASLWNNLARAELEAGTPQQVVACVAQLLALDPASDALMGWAEQAQAWRAAGDLQAARALLEALQPYGSREQRQEFLPLLAELLELEGAYREAALLYRELLRPTLAP